MTYNSSFATNFFDQWALAAAASAALNKLKNIDGAIRLITHIALQCGFFDNSHFTRLFKKKMGVSPLQFRKVFVNLDNRATTCDNPLVFDSNGTLFHKKYATS